MKDFLKRIKLIEHFTTEIAIPKTDFVTKFRYHVDEGSIGIFSDAFDIFSSSKNEYKGYVGFDGFKIKRRRKFFDMYTNLAVAKGTYRQDREKLIIKAEINGFSGKMIPFYLFAIVFYSIFIGVFFMTDGLEGNASGFVLPFILIHAALMFGLPYIAMRKSTKRMMHELEREFYYMTKK